MTQDKRVLTNIQDTPFGPSVTLPNSTDIQATQSGQLHLRPSLSKRAKKAHILSGIPISSLISIGQLCDDDCIAVLNKHKLKVFKDKDCILAIPGTVRSLVLQPTVVG
jgi:hypothetical protein